MKIIRKRIGIILVICMAVLLTACGDRAAQDAVISQESVIPQESSVLQETEGLKETAASQESASSQEPSQLLPVEGNDYYDLENVVLYLELYDTLPPNYITKDEAEALGWTGGSVEKYRDGAAIGGDSFGNREGLLPKADGRKYRECDLDTDGQNARGAKRLLYSNDGLYFYTEDHYESFSQVYVLEDYTVEVVASWN